MHCKHGVPLAKQLNATLLDVCSTWVASKRREVHISRQARQVFQVLPCQTRQNSSSGRGIIILKAGCTLHSQSIAILTRSSKVSHKLPSLELGA